MFFEILKEIRSFQTRNPVPKNELDLAVWLRRTMEPASVVVRICLTYPASERPQVEDFFKKILKRLHKNANSKRPRLSPPCLQFLTVDRVASGYFGPVPTLSTSKFFRVELSFRYDKFEEIPVRGGHRMVPYEVFYHEAIDWKLVEQEHGAQDERRKKHE